MSVLILVSVVVTAQRVMCCMCFKCYLRTAVLFYLSVLFNDAFSSFRDR